MSDFASETAGPQVREQGISKPSPSPLRTTSFSPPVPAPTLGPPPVLHLVRATRQAPSLDWACEDQSNAAGAHLVQGPV